MIQQLSTLASTPAEMSTGRHLWKCIMEKQCIPASVLCAVSLIACSIARQIGSEWDTYIDLATLSYDMALLCHGHPLSEHSLETLEHKRVTHFKEPHDYCCQASTEQQAQDIQTAPIVQEFTLPITSPNTHEHTHPTDGPVQRIRHSGSS